MMNSIYNLHLSFGRFLIHLFHWLDWENGIDTSGLMNALDWYYWLLWVVRATAENRKDLNTSFPVAWYWGQVNAENSHNERPWALWTEDESFPF